MPRNYNLPNRDPKQLRIMQNMNTNFHKNSCLFNTQKNVAVRTVVWTDPWNFTPVESLRLVSTSKLPTYLGYELYLACVHQITGKTQNKQQLLTRVSSWDYTNPIEMRLRDLVNLTNFNVRSPELKSRVGGELKALAEAELQILESASFKKRLTTMPGVLFSDNETEIKSFRFLEKVDLTFGVAQILLHPDVKSLFESSRSSINLIQYTNEPFAHRKKGQILSFLNFLIARFSETSQKPFEILRSDLVSNMNLANYNEYLIRLESNASYSDKDALAVQVKMNLGKAQLQNSIFPKTQELFEKIHGKRLHISNIGDKRTDWDRKDRVLEFSLSACKNGKSEALTKPKILNDL